MPNIFFLYASVVRSFNFALMSAFSIFWLKSSKFISIFLVFYDNIFVCYILVFFPESIKTKLIYFFNRSSFNTKQPLINLIELNGNLELNLKSIFNFWNHFTILIMNCFFASMKAWGVIPHNLWRPPNNIGLCKIKFTAFQFYSFMTNVCVGTYKIKIESIFLVI